MLTQMTHKLGNGGCDTAPCDRLNAIGNGTQGEMTAARFDLLHYGLNMARSAVVAVAIQGWPASMASPTRAKRMR